MKIRTEQTDTAEPEIIIRYQEMNSELAEVMDYLKCRSTQLTGRIRQKTYLFSPADILYFESVDNVVYAYETQKVFQTGYTLQEVEDMLNAAGFFRCNKSFVVNLKRINSVTGIMGSRIDARLENGEHIIISRHYAKDFRSRLKGDREWRK